MSKLSKQISLMKMAYILFRRIEIIAYFSKDVQFFHVYYAKRWVLPCDFILKSYVIPCIYRHATVFGV